MTGNLHPPRGINLFNAIAKPLLAAGVPLGPNGLLTVRGRTSGEPRTTPVAVIEDGGGRWIWAPWGEVNWVRNLRAAGEATIEVHRKRERVTATELTPEQRLAFFRDTYGPLIRRIRGGTMFVRLFDGVDVNDPEGAARGRVVFQLRAPNSPRQS